MHAPFTRGRADSSHLLEVRSIVPGLREAAVARLLGAAGGPPATRCELKWAGDATAIAVFESGVCAPRAGRSGACLKFFGFLQRFPARI